MIDNVYESGRWRHGVPFGNDPEGKTLGILGMGGIGKALAKRMLGFDMKIQYHNRTKLDAEGTEEMHKLWYTLGNSTATDYLVLCSGEQVSSILC